MDFDLDAGLFDEPPGFRPPTPPPFNPKLECYTLEDGQELSLRLVSSSPLWGHVLYPSAVCLAKYLEANPELVKGRRVSIARKSCVLVVD